MELRGDGFDCWLLCHICNDDGIRGLRENMIRGKILALGSDD